MILVQLVQGLCFKSHYLYVRNINIEVEDTGLGLLVPGASPPVQGGPPGATSVPFDSATCSELIKVEPVQWFFPRTGNLGRRETD